MNLFQLQMNTLHEIFNWRVSLDILLIAIGIYFLYHTLRSLGTWKIVVGIISALLLYMAAGILGLNGIRWFFSNFSHVALLALVIIFQPEIRKIFERVVSLRRMESSEETSSLSRKLADSIISLSQQGRGAIFVFPGKESIQAWTSEGVRMEAVPSLPIILSIFDPHSPGHDGAIVIQDGKITSFSVRLPISESGRLSEMYGTRHHAAMGLSEVTDALVLVVSEERKAVSAFLAGTMQPVSGGEQIAQIIESHWQKATAFPLVGMTEKGKRFAFSEIAASLLLAFLFWSTVVLSQLEVREKSYTVPVEYTGSDSRVVIVGAKPTEAKIHLLGTRSDLDMLNSSQLVVKVDLSKAEAGRQIIGITRETMSLPKKLKLVNVEPAVVELTLEKIEEKDAAIRPQLVGRLPAGLTIRSLVVKPDKVRILSAPSASDGEELTLLTTPIYLESIFEDTSVYGKIISPSNIQPASKRWPDVEVRIRLLAVGKNENIKSSK